MKVELKPKTLELYKYNINQRHWLSWDEFLTIKVGDEIKMPLFFENTDRVIGDKIIKVEKVYRKISTDNWDSGLEHGCLCGKLTEYTYDGKARYGSIGGTFAVNLEGIEEVETIESVKKKLIEASLSYIGKNYNNVDLTAFEKYLNRQ